MRQAGVGKSTAGRSGAKGKGKESSSDAKATRTPAGKRPARAKADAQVVSDASTSNARSSGAKRTAAEPSEESPVKRRKTSKDTHVAVSPTAAGKKRVTGKGKAVADVVSPLKVTKSGRTSRAPKKPDQ